MRHLDYWRIDMDWIDIISAVIGVAAIIYIVTGAIHENTTE